MKKLLPVFLIILSLLFTSCNLGGQRRCEDILLELLPYTSGDSRDNGSIFLLSAKEGSAEFFSKENKAMLFGENALEHSFSKIEDCAIFISSRYPEEIAVFKCYSSSDTDEVVKMCLERADSINVALRSTEWSDKAQSTRISVVSKFVLMALTDEPDRIEEKMRSAI